MPTLQQQEEYEDNKLPDMRKKKNTSEVIAAEPPTVGFLPLTGEAPLGLEIVMKARGFLGTPFFHAGREKGLGVDCIGLIICVAHELGLTDYDNHNYQPNNIDTEFLRSEIEKFCHSIPKSELVDGDIIIFSIQGRPQHIGIYTSDLPMGTIIHADQSSGKVVEDFYDRKLRMQTAYCYRWRRPLESG